MTRCCLPSASASPLPKPEPLRPHDLAWAPELASLCIVQDALHTALLALVAAHPTIQDFSAQGEPPSLRLARRLVASASALDLSLRRYRSAVLDSLRPCPPQPDDPIF